MNVTTMPAYIAVPTPDNAAYLVAPVVAAIPVSFDGSVYAVTAINPEPPFGFIAAETFRNTIGAWTTDETHPSGSLDDAISDMATLAGRRYPRLL